MKAGFGGFQLQDIGRLGIQEPPRRIMNHKEFLISLDSDQKAALTRKSDWAGLFHLAAYIVLLAGFGWIIANGFSGWQLALIPYGILLTFLFTLEHEATHRTPFSTIWLNDLVGRVCGLILILPFEWFRSFHMAHHRFTNDPENDPELAGDRTDTWKDFLIHISGWRYWRGMIRQLFLNASGLAKAPWLSDRAIPRLQREAIAMLLIYCAGLATLVFNSALLWLWLVPLVIGQPFLRLYLLAEHGKCAPVADMFENTRTTFTNFLVRFIAWNMPFHAEHHAFPNVPFWQLPELHRLAKEHLKVTAKGYAAFTGEYLKDMGTD